MTLKNELKIAFPALSCNEKVARMCITSFISVMNPSVSELAEIKTAVSEAVTNCIVHGYREKEGKVEILVRAYDDNTVIIKITDHGCGIEDVKKAMEPLYTSAPEEERAGIGFAVMQSFMDRLTVKSEKEKGTVITMEKKILSSIGALHN